MFIVVQFRQYSTVHYCKVPCITVHYHALQYSRGYYSTAEQCSALQYSTVQYRTIQGIKVQQNSAVQYSRLQLLHPVQTVTAQKGSEWSLNPLSGPGYDIHCTLSTFNMVQYSRVSHFIKEKHQM